MNDLYIINPSHNIKEEILDYKQEYIDFGEKNINGSCGLMRSNDIDEWLSLVHDIKKNKLRNGVHASTFLTVRKSDKKIVGSFQVRHFLTDELKNMEAI